MENHALQPLKVDAAWFSETMVSNHQTKQRNNPENDRSDSTSNS
jgi:hypothetical protein